MFLTVYICYKLLKPLEIVCYKILSIVNKLKTSYSNAVIFIANSTTPLSLEPEITELLAKSRDHDELKWVWKEWYNATGPNMKSTYVELVKALNQGVQDKGYDDASQEWINELETNDFEQTVGDLNIRLKPLYKQLHAYVRRKLRYFYGADKFKSRKIPIHLLGSLMMRERPCS
jgi:peptidyl-dipeptidase A